MGFIRTVEGGWFQAQLTRLRMQGLPLFVAVIPSRAPRVSRADPAESPGLGSCLGGGGGLCAVQLVQGR